MTAPFGLSQVNDEFPVILTLQGGTLYIEIDQELVRRPGLNSARHIFF